MQHEEITKYCDAEFGSVVTISLQPQSRTNQLSCPYSKFWKSIWNQENPHSSLNISFD